MDHRRLKRFRTPESKEPTDWSTKMINDVKRNTTETENNCYSVQQSVLKFLLPCSFKCFVVKSKLLFPNLSSICLSIKLLNRNLLNRITYIRQIFTSGMYYCKLKELTKKQCTAQSICSQATFPDQAVDTQFSWRIPQRWTFHSFYKYPRPVHIGAAKKNAAFEIFCLEIEGFHIELCTAGEIPT